MDQCQGQRLGIIVTCEGGSIAGLTGAVAFDNGGKVLEKFPGDGGSTHMQNFLNAVRSRRSDSLAAPAALGHLAAATCHYGNISYRLGKPAGLSEGEAALGRVDAAREIFRELQQHVSVHGIDLSRQRFTVGLSVHPDETGDGIASVSSESADDQLTARYLLRETQRPPYRI